MKKGFTMIELIFVIVILGILAAVAIPRLSATRDDAVVSKAAQEVSIAVSDITTYYTANGSFGKSTEMTNVKLDADANVTTGFYYELVAGDNCVRFLSASVAAATDGNITVSFPATGTGNCLGLQQALAATDMNRTYSVGGRRVKY